jgi:glycosyltransferase involved in cell wall biosynthesis
MSRMENKIKVNKTLSVCIITQNEADRIRRCLDSIKSLADEIIVFDSGSHDRTVDIVKEYTNKVWVTDWPGYGAQRQRSLAKATKDWVLIIDADEWLDSTLQNEILNVLISEKLEYVGFKLKLGPIRHGKLLRYGRSANSQLRLLVREGTWFTPDIVHEKINHKPGKIGMLKGFLMHESVRDYGHALDKNAKYAWLGSQKYYARGKRNRSMLIVLLRSVWTFVLIYFLRRGFLDGRIGFIVAMNYAQSNFNKHAGLWILTQESNFKSKT